MSDSTARRTISPRYALGVGLAFLLVPGPAIAFDPAQASEQKCTVSGTVVWPQDSPRDPGDRIKARFFGPTVEMGLYEMADWHLDVPVEEGSFAATLPRHAPAALSIFVARAEHGDFLFAHAREVGCGAHVRLELRAAPRLSGRAVDDLGQPLERVRIVAQQGSAELPNSSTERLQRTIACDEGAFVVPLCSDGTWHVVAEADGHAASRVAIVTLPHDDPLELVLPRGGTVAGRIVDADGNGVAGVAVRAIPKVHVGADYFGVGTRSAISDAEGRFALTGTCTGAIELAVQAEPPVPRMQLTVKPGERIEDVVVRVTKQP